MKNEKTKSYAIIILAAGTSSRLGRPKQLVKHPNGNLLSHTIDTASKIKNANTYVILGAYAREISEVINTEIATYINPNWERGMGNSIAFGVENIRDIGYDAVILTVCDQPYLEAIHFDQLIKMYEDNTVADLIISKYTNGNGPPSMFDSQYFDQLCKLDGDNRAKTIVKNNLSNVGFSGFEKGDIDIDTEADLKSF